MSARRAGLIELRCRARPWIRRRSACIRAKARAWRSSGRMVTRAHGPSAGCAMPAHAPPVTKRGRQRAWSRVNARCRQPSFCRCTKRRRAPTALNPPGGTLSSFTGMMATRAESTPGIFCAATASARSAADSAQAKTRSGSRRRCKLFSPIFREVVLNVGQELDQLRADYALCCDGHGADDGFFESGVFIRVVEVRDAARNKVAGNVGVIRSPLSVVAAAPEGGAGGIAKAPYEGITGTHTKAAWVLFEQHGEHGIAPEVAIRRIGVSSSEALEVSGRALAEAPGDNACGPVRIGHG